MQSQEIDQETHEVMAELMLSYQRDPVFFVEHALGHLTWSKQREVLRSVGENERTAVRASHSVSKTYSAAEVVVWFLNCFPDSKVITTAPTWTQMAKLLWAEIRAIYTRSRLALEGECLMTEIKTDDPDHYAIGFSTDKPARAEGWHAPAILFILDEAKGIPQWLWDSVRGSMTGGFCRRARDLHDGRGPGRRAVLEDLPGRGLELEQGPHLGLRLALRDGREVSRARHA